MLQKRRVASMEQHDAVEQPEVADDSWAGDVSSSGLFWPPQQSLIDLVGLMYVIPSSNQTLAYLS